MRWKSAFVKGRKIICLTLSVIICIILFAGAVVSVPVPVLALSVGGVKSTIASIVISLLLQTGVAPTNTTWLNQLNNAYGVTSTIGTIDDCIASGLLTETASGLVDTGLSSAIASAPEYTSLGLDALFGTTATDIGVTAATGASNLATTAINVGTLGTIGAFAGAAAVGVGLGVLINHVREKIADYIKYNITGDTTNTDFLDRVPSQYTKMYYVERINNNNHMIYEAIKFVPSDVYAVGWKDSGAYVFQGQLFRGREEYNGYNYYITTGRPSTNSPPGIIDSESEIQNGSFKVSYFNGNNIVTGNNLDRVFNNYTEYLNWKTALEAGQTEPLNKPVYSYDFIGPLGNHYPSTDPETGNTVFPGIGNILPEGYDMKPVDMDDYFDYVDQANDNTANNLTGEDTQGVEFNDFVEPYLVAPDVVPDPDPDAPIIPENPEVIPAYPERPLSPEQPDEIPEKPDVTDEQIDESLNLATTPDLRGVFPFCIPWDIYNIVHIFDTGNSRTAPHIVFTFPGTNWSIDVDLSAFNSVAAILRILELILFIVGLAVATRSLIGAGG